ncbi:PREDICTED: uncharacterized protein LOC107191492 [Dufourea novaeangliae]|uniref:uncharacterized protein LOC107191492 n=1 Tax=Dufourea novaeangliae TaxID=178035 RepID=UPI000767C917|nr:PREDICTED: uncharacterized protein LOC107191492 [Dufourea novaeangliae]
MSKAIGTIFLALCLVSLIDGQGSLLDMSQQLWAKLLSGGFSKAGKLDPLRVPVIKVDQSEGDTSYRIILRNVEINGLNDSTVESIHIAKGRLKSNLSELEAGYVSYSDLRDLDSIRYRFHTLIKEPKLQNESFEAIVSATNQENKFKAASSEQERRYESLRRYDPFLMRIQAEQMREPADQKDQKTTQESNYGRFSMEGARVVSRPEIARMVDGPRYPSDVQTVYASKSGANSRNYQQRENYDRTRQDSYPERYQENDQRYDDVQTAASESVERRVKGQTILPGAAARESVSQAGLEKKPGYIDIVYADGNNNGSVKRFGNGRIESKEDAMVYGVKDIPMDVLEKRKMLSHNCTDGEPLTKRNDAIKAAIETKSLKDLKRYATDYQEKQGYFEEGMQLVYHYGGMDSKNSRDSKNAPGTRQKRAHKENETDDDVMHVILKIRVPSLRIKSDYQLTGKVGKELVRGNGRLNGNFTELVGDFTIELKKIKGQDTLTVRAARSKLSAKTQKVDLQGMDEKGPVKSILSRGLMAAEAVAAMLADDLATKALNEKTADAMIYRMYKNLPVN